MKDEKFPGAERYKEFVKRIEDSYKAAREKVESYKKRLGEIANKGYSELSLIHI